MLIGVAAAYLGGAWDGGLNLLTDVLLVIPLFPLLIVIASYLHGAGTVVMIAVIILTGWSYTARQLRAQALSLRNRDFLEAARVRGERPLYIIVVEIIPTMTSLLVASFLTNALYAVLFSSSLQFIGLGNPTVISWGTMLYWAENDEAFQTGQALWIIVPGLCIVALGAAFALLNYAFDEIGNPALRPVRSMRGKRVKRCQGNDVIGTAPTGTGRGATGAMLEVRDLSVEYVMERGTVRAVDDVSFDLDAGRVRRHRRRVRLRQVHPAVRHRPAAGPPASHHRRQRHVQGPRTWSGSPTSSWPRSAGRTCRWSCRAR